MAAATAAAAAQQPVQVVGNAFVQQYYHIQHQSPRLVHRFYKNISKLGRPDGDGIMTTTTRMQAIDKKIQSLNYGEFRAEIKSVDAQESYNWGVHILVTGYLLGKDNMIKNFTQTFFLAPQEKGYFVLNDIFRYVEDIKPHSLLRTSLIRPEDQGLIIVGDRSVMSAATEAAAAAQQPVPAQVVGNAFIEQYYHILHQSPCLIHRFYQNISKLGRPDGDGGMTTTSTMQAIDEKILSLNYGEFRAEIKSVDAQESYNEGVHVLVTGCLLGKDNMIKNFTQTFFLAPQEKGYFVLNDIFRYVEDIKPQNGNQSSDNDIEAPLTPEQDIRLCYQIQARNKDRRRQTNENRGRQRRTGTDRDRRRLLMAGEDLTTTNRGRRSPDNDNRDPFPGQENHVSEQTVALIEVNGDEDVNTSDNGGVLVEEEEVTMAEVVDEEVPVAEVVDEVPDDSQVVVESNSKIEEVPKKSYASIRPFSALRLCSVRLLL